MADENKNENNTPSAEDYAALKSELEAERAKAATLVEEAVNPLQAQLGVLQAEIDTKTADIEAMKGTIGEASTNFEGAKAAYAYAVEDFKKLAAASNPLIPPEAIYGGSIEEIKMSLDRANKLVANVQESLAKQAQQNLVPAGAPQRTGPDLSALSTKEKITVGLEAAKAKKEQ